MKLCRAMQAWGTPAFRDVLGEEIRRLPVGELPLQQALRSGSFVLDEPPEVIVNGIDEYPDRLDVRIGLFFAAIDAGSCCADDPTTVEPHQEYCVIRLEIERATAETRIVLLDD